MKQQNWTGRNSMSISAPLNHIVQHARQHPGIGPPDAASRAIPARCRPRYASVYTPV
jgi:hypothetical protein